MLDVNQLDDVYGKEVVDADGDKIGKVGQIYLDDETGGPEWVTVQTGLFGKNETFIPLSEASYTGGSLRVPYDKSKVKDAPNVAADGHLSPDEEERLYQYYGVQYSAGAAGGYYADDTSRSETTGRRGVVGNDVSGPETDEAMTRSEEQLRVGTERVEAGRVRLRKHIVSENVSKTVPVSREEVRVEREPITDANVGAAMAGPELSEEEHEVVLTEERPVVQKEAVPVERVRLDKDTVTEQQRVDETVRREEIEVDDGSGVDRTDRR